jgi:hypothetical protein
MVSSAPETPRHACGTLAHADSESWQRLTPAAAETEEQLARAGGGGDVKEYDKKAAKLEDR